MKKLIIMLWAVALAAVVPSPAFGNIVYSGSQNVTLGISPMSPMASKTIQLGGMAEDWDDFRVELWLDMGMPGMPGMVGMDMMSMGSRLAIYAPGALDGDAKGMGIGMGGILGLRGLALNVPMGGPIGGDSFFDVFFDVMLPDGSGEFGEDGGYIGLRTAMGQNGWLHMLRQSKIGTENHSVVFDGWAFEDQPGVPIVAGQGKTCDWVRGRPYKMHWPQLPDLGSTGIDISLSRTPLADDFKCTATGAITDIHIWGSFWNDVLPPGGPESLTLQLSIYSDIPATTAVWSRPGSLMWTRTFKPGEYSARRVHDGPEDWYDPVTGQYLPANHRQAFQYNFCIDRDAFVQKEGTVYWLVVDDLSTNATSANVGSTFGWKTTSPRYHWNDDAVYQGGANAAWTAMIYPKGHRYEGRTLDLAFVITGDDKPSESDLGDAPDSSNSFPDVTMLAYPSGVLGHFPTVYQAGSPPYGPLHRHPRDMFFLGKRVSLETEADIGPDEDGVNNLAPAGAPSPTEAPTNTTETPANWGPGISADRDGADDGLHLPITMRPITVTRAEPICTTMVDYDVTCTSPQPTRAYVNMWFDFNRDGDWDDLLSAPDGAVEPEWAVQNQVVSLPGPGEYTFTSPPFNCSHLISADLSPLWVRINIAETQHFPSIILIDAEPGFEGAGPVDGYEYGETEDYFTRPLLEATALKYDWGDAPETAAAAGYPTLSASDGARHVPVGPWLGDDSDMPDSEPDGQPDTHALGDDNNPAAADDDEDGVSIPPLVQGQLAHATIQVNGGGGRVQGWIDFNRDRQWQAAESVFDGFLPDGVHVIPFPVPNAAIVGQSFARFRISRQGGLGPVGEARDGEVEDHEVSISAPPTDGKTWCQPPDLTPRGIDIRVDNQALADDFQCKSTGLLTHIRLWGSWRGDHKGQIKKIQVQIHPDDPVGPEGADTKNTFSKPGPETLWSGDFVPGQFLETLYHVVGGKGEWWWDPISEKASPGGDTQVWQIDMEVESANAFKQEGTAAKPRIYWLVVRVQTADGEFGWKTRRWPEHFMDDAVWEISPTSPVVWDELRYPHGHPYFDSERNSIDLAFCLMFSTGTPPPTILPGTATACPAVETKCPVIETRCPPLETKCPAEDTKCPPVQTRCPPLATRCPESATKCPESATKCPPTETKCPAEDTKCPVEATKCPPTSVTKCPITETRCPPIETKCPVEDTKCPAEQTRCPVEPTKCPPTSVTKCPMFETRCPPIETKCPVEDTKCPAEQTKCPVSFTACPPSATKCPPAVTQCSATKCPVATQCPTVETQCPPVDTQCGWRETECPVTPTACPIVLTQCPTPQTSCPVEPTKCPPAETKCPVEDTKCPTEQTRCPPLLTRCPPTPTKCQTGATVCPPTDTRCPAEETKCPVEETKLPADSH